MKKPVAIAFCALALAAAPAAAFPVKGRSQIGRAHV
jgi:hypothetical protein